MVCFFFKCEPIKGNSMLNLYLANKFGEDLIIEQGEFSFLTKFYDFWVIYEIRRSNCQNYVWDPPPSNSAPFNYQSKLITSALTQLAE